MKQREKRGVATETIEIGRVVPVKVRLHESQNRMFQRETVWRGDILNDQGTLFGHTEWYGQKRGLTRGLDRFFGKDGWVEVK